MLEPQTAAVLLRALRTATQPGVVVRLLAGLVRNRVCICPVP